MSLDSATRPRPCHEKSLRFNYSIPKPFRRFLTFSFSNKATFMVAIERGITWKGRKSFATYLPAQVLIRRQRQSLSGNSHLGQKVAALQRSRCVRCPRSVTCQDARRRHRTPSLQICHTVHNTVRSGEQRGFRVHAAILVASAQLRSPRQGSRVSTTTLL